MSLIVATEQAPISALQPYPGNARRGNIEVIRESLRVHGQYKPIVVQKGTGYVLAGNHTMQAAILEGWKDITVTWVDCDEQQARKINLIDNRANDIAGYDDEALAELLQGLDNDLTGTGFTAVDVDDLLASLGGGFSKTAKDYVPPLPEQAVTQPGDVIELGPHRLVCGDSLDPAVRAAALGAAMADLVVTDPPYMVNHADPYNDHRHPSARRMRMDNKRVENDNLQGDEAQQFITDAMSAVRDSLKAGGVFYVCAPPGPDELRFRVGLRDAGLELRQVVLWVKDRFVFGRQDYQWRHESVLYGWRDGAAHFFVDDHTQDTVWECERPARSKEHPTMKPTALLERMIENSSRKGELVFDPFGGSGSTLVAAMSKGRRCALIELDPGYCDVIVGRYEKLTGLTVRPQTTTNQEATP